MCYLTGVGKISGAYRNTVPKEPVMPNLPIMLNVILSGDRSTPLPVNKEFCQRYLQFMAVCIYYSVFLYFTGKWKKIQYFKQFYWIHRARLMGSGNWSHFNLTSLKCSKSFNMSKVLLSKIFKIIVKAKTKISQSSIPWYGWNRTYTIMQKMILLSGK